MALPCTNKSFVKPQCSDGSNTYSLDGKQGVNVWACRYNSVNRIYPFISRGNTVTPVV